jgi:hypothetical protein
VTVVAIIAICVVLLVLGFLLPRLSRHPQRAVDRTLDAGGRAAGTAPGPVGRLLRKPFQSGKRAADRSAAAGRRGHSKLRP